MSMADLASEDVSKLKKLFFTYIIKPASNILPQLQTYSTVPFSINTKWVSQD